MVIVRISAQAQGRESGLMSKHSVVTLLSLALVVVVAVNCALLTGFLSWRGGANPPNAILKGGAAFGGTLVVGLALLSALNVL
jgi:hypothetical protein